MLVLAKPSRNRESKYPENVFVYDDDDDDDSVSIQNQFCLKIHRKCLQLI